jgi:hypothetical protein
MFYNQDVVENIVAKWGFSSSELILLSNLKNLSLFGALKAKPFAD